MATIAVVLKTKQKLTNDEYAVALTVTHERQSKYYVISSFFINRSFQFRCKLKNWKPAGVEDNGFGRLRKSFKDYRKLNTILESKLSEARTLLEYYDKGGFDFDFTQFEVDLKHKEHSVILSVDTYYGQQILILEQQGRIGLAGLYLEVQRILKKFKLNALLLDVNVRFLESFEYWMRNTRGNKDTTISVKMRNLQRVINQTIEDKLFKEENYPFGEKYSTNKRLDNKTKKIAITLDKIGKLKDLKLDPGSALHLA